MNVLISDTTQPNFGTPNHPVLVRDSFLTAYPDFDGEFFFLPNAENPSIIDLDSSAYAFAQTNNCPLIIRSIQGASSLVSAAQGYYPEIQVIMPAGSNDHELVYSGALDVIIITGGGDDANETGYKIEFYANDPTTPETIPDESDLSSFSNGLIAGYIALIMDTLNETAWAARYLLRQALGNNPTDENGYGKITGEVVAAAMALYNPSTDYGALDPYILHIGEVGTITAPKWFNNVNLRWDAIENATAYEVEKNGVEIVDANILLYLGVTITETTTFRYRGKFTNAFDIVEYSDWAEDTVKYFVKEGLAFIEI